MSPRDRLTTDAESLDFVTDGGYAAATLWRSEGLDDRLSRWTDSERLFSVHELGAP